MSEGDPVAVTPPGTVRRVGATSFRDTKIPLMDPAKLSKHYGIENRDRIEEHVATVMLPVDLDEEPWHRQMSAALATFIEQMGKQGWTLHTKTGFSYERGRYPAVDLASGIADPSREEWRWRAWFSFDNPKPVQISVDPRLVGELEPAS
jgi:hypothetical protein